MAHLRYRYLSNICDITFYLWRIGTASGVDTLSHTVICLLMYPQMRLLTDPQMSPS